MRVWFAFLLGWVGGGLDWSWWGASLRAQLAASVVLCHGAVNEKSVVLLPRMLGRDRPSSPLAPLEAQAAKTVKDKSVMLNAGCWKTGKELWFYLDVLGRG